jgi:aminopeptidase N
VRVGEQKIGDYLALAEGLQSDRTRAVVEELTGQLDYISENLVTEQDRPGYQRWVRQLLTPVAQELGWNTRAGDNDETKTLRARVLFTLGSAGKDPEVLAQARKLTDEALASPSSIDHTMAFTVFRLAAQNGDATLYDRIAQKLQNKDATPEEYYLYFGTLSEFSDPELLKRTLEMAVSPSVRSQDSLGLVSSVMENPAGAELSWNFVRDHWADIEKVGGGFTSGEVVAATSSYCDAHLRDEVQAFFATHKVPSAERTLKQSLERMNYCIDLKTQQSPQLSAWLEQHRGAAGR